MSSQAGFFDAKQAAAVQKHKMLGSYATVFVSKTGKRDGIAAIIDGNAGPGQYANGDHGSPMLLADVAASVAEVAQRVTVLTFVEKKRHYARQLRDLLTERAVQHAEVFPGDLDEHVSDALRRSAGMPLLTFLDPFGGSISFDTVTQRLMGRRGVPSEVLLHFSLISVRRKGPAALNEITSPKVGEQLDRFLGGNWWESIMADRDPSEPGSATRQALRISQIYRRRVEERCRCSSVAVNVRPAPTHLPVYRMILFTRSPHGLWHFADAAGAGFVEWATYCDDAAFREQQLEAEATGAMKLWDDLPPDRTRIAQTIEDESVPIIRRNLERLLADSGSIHLGWNTEDVFGVTIGRAQQKHARKAVRQLMEDGVVKPVSLSNMATVTLELRR